MAVRRTEVTADTTVREINRLAKSDIRRFYDAYGNLLPIHSLPDDLAACIQSIEVVKRNLTSGDGKTEKVWKINTTSSPDQPCPRLNSVPPSERLTVGDHRYRISSGGCSPWIFVLAVGRPRF